MKNILLHFGSKKKIKCLLLLSFLTLQGMDHPDHKPILNEYVQNLKKKADVPVFEKKVELWQNNQLIEEGREFKRCIPRSMIITPDEKGLIYTLPGKVCFIAKDNITESNPHIIYTHSDASYYPMIAAAIKGKKLKIVSIVNKIKQKPECVISLSTMGKLANKSHNIFSSTSFEFLDIGNGAKTTGLNTVWEDVNVQAIALSPSGEHLAIGLGNRVLIIDLVLGISRFSNFVPYSHGSFVVDVSAPIDNFLSPDEKHLTAVNNLGIIDCKKLSSVEPIGHGNESDDLLTNVKNAATGDRIENIHLMKETKEIWYVTENGKVNTVGIRTFLEHCEKSVKKRIVSHHEGSKASVDQGLAQTTIHWEDNPLLVEDLRLSMNVYRENNTDVEHFIIKIPDLLFSKVYNFITAEGQKASLPTHILLAAVRGNSVVAVTTEGMAYFWKLPEMYRKPTEEDVRADIRPIKTISRQRSLSSPGLPNDAIRKITSIGGDEKRRSSKRNSQVPKLNIFKSKESLKESSASPTESPRKKPSTPRRKGSMPQHATTDAPRTDRESKFETARRADIYNDFNRKTDS